MSNLGTFQCTVCSVICASEAGLALHTAMHNGSLQVMQTDPTTLPDGYSNQVIKVVLEGCSKVAR